MIKKEQKKFIGAHVSIAGGIDQALDRIHDLNGDALAIFVKNQRQWTAPPLAEEVVASFKEKMQHYNIKPGMVLVHDSYLINLGNGDDAKRAKSYDAFIDESHRLETLGLQLLNFHPGSHLKEISEEKCLDLISDSLNRAISETENIVFVMENTAGQGSNLGYKFEHLSYIISKIKDKSRIGVCLDTCHTFAAGYDFYSSKENYEKVMSEFERIVGFHYLRGVHLNDSKCAFASRKDRHEEIGKGHIGPKAFEYLMQDERFNGIPMVLETPNMDNWANEILILKGLC